MKSERIKDNYFTSRNVDTLSIINNLSNSIDEFIKDREDISDSEVMNFYANLDKKLVKLVYENINEEVRKRYSTDLFSKEEIDNSSQETSQWAILAATAIEEGDMNKLKKIIKQKKNGVKIDRIILEMAYES